MENRVSGISETVAEAAGLMHVAKNGWTQGVTFVSEATLGGVDREVPVRESHRWIDCLQRLFKDVCELRVLHQDSISVMNVIRFAICGIEMMEAKEISDIMEVLSVEGHSFRLRRDPNLMHSLYKCSQICRAERSELSTDIRAKQLATEGTQHGSAI